MEELNYFIIETGERLPTGIRVIKVSFDADEIAENREDGESDEDVVNYLLNDIVDEAAQQFCNALILTEQQFKEVQNYGK